MSTTVSTQHFAADLSIIHITAASLILYRLRNNIELESCLEKVSDFTGNIDLRTIYKVARKTNLAFYMLYIAARKVSEMFFGNFKERIQLEGVGNGWYF